MFVPEKLYNCVFGLTQNFASLQPGWANCLILNVLCAIAAIETRHSTSLRAGAETYAAIRTKIGKIIASSICFCTRLALSFDKIGCGSTKPNYSKLYLFLYSPYTIFVEERYVKACIEKDNSLNIF